MKMRNSHLIISRINLKNRLGLGLLRMLVWIWMVWSWRTKIVRKMIIFGVLSLYIVIYWNRVGRVGKVRIVWGVERVKVNSRYIKRIWRCRRSCRKEWGMINWVVIMWIYRILIWMIEIGIGIWIGVIGHLSRIRREVVGLISSRVVILGWRMLSIWKRWKGCRRKKRLKRYMMRLLSMSLNRLM